MNGGSLQSNWAKLPDILTTTQTVEAVKPVKQINNL